MNHYTAMQPPHLNGRWQYVQLSRRGGGPICGCTIDEGHETREEAERHMWETYTALAYVHEFDDPLIQRRCEECTEWTTHRIIVRVNHLHDDVHVLCSAHRGQLDPDAALAWVRDLVPFQPNRESFGTL